MRNLDNWQDDELFQRVLRAMREAGRGNEANSPFTDLEAMARAAIEEILTHER